MSKEMLARAAQPVIGGLEAIGNLIDIPASMGRDIMSLNNPLDQLLTPFSSKNRIEGRDVLRKYGVVGKEDNWQNWLGGLAFEIATDPLTYMTFGASAASKAIKPAGKALQHAGYFDEARKLSGLGHRAFRSMKVGDALDLVKNHHKSANKLAPDTIDTIFDVSAKTMNLDPTLARNEKIGDLVGFHLPFTSKTAGWTPKAGGRAHDILVTGADKLGQYMYDLPVMSHARALFQRSAMGQTDAKAQDLARGITAAKDLATTQARMKVAPTAAKLYERGFMRNAETAVEDSQALWLLLEGHDLDKVAELAPAMKKTVEHAKEIQDQFGDVVSELQGHADEMRRIGAMYGIEPDQLNDQFINHYFPRQRNRLVKFFSSKARGLGPEEKLADTRMPSSWARDPKLMNIRGGTASINNMSVDPRISGIAHRMGGYAVDGKIPAGDIERVSNILKSEYGMKPIDVVKEGQDPEGHIKQLAKWLMELDPRHAQSPSGKKYSPAFKFDPIENLMDTYENAYRASAAAELTFEQIAARAAVTEQMGPDWVSIKDVMQGMHMGMNRNEGRPMKQLAMLLSKNPEFMDRLGPHRGEIEASMELFLKTGQTTEWMDKLSLPPEVAGPLTKYMKSFVDPEELSGFLKFFDASTALYKGSLTTMWPAFHGRNVMSAMFQNYIGGAHDPTAPVYMRYIQPYLDAAEILAGKSPDKEIANGVTYDRARKYMWASGLTQPASSSEALEGVADVNLKASVPSNVVGDKSFKQQVKNVWAHFQEGVSEIGDMNPFKRKDIQLPAEQIKIYQKIFGDTYEDSARLKALMGTADITGNPASDWGYTRHQAPSLKKIKRKDLTEKPKPRTAEDIAGAPPELDEYEPFSHLIDEDGITTWIDSEGQPFDMKFSSGDGGLTVRLSEIEGVTSQEAKIAKRGKGGRGFERFVNEDDLQAAISENEGIAFPLPVNKAKGDYYISPREVDSIGSKVISKFREGSIPPKDASNDEIRQFLSSYAKLFRKEAGNYRGWEDASDEVRESIVTQAVSDFAYRSYGPHVQTARTREAIRQRGLENAKARKAYQDKLAAANEELARGQELSQEGLIGDVDFDPMEMSWSNVMRSVHDPTRPKSGKYYVQFKGNPPQEFGSADAAQKAIRKLAKENNERVNWADKTKLSEYNYGEFGTYGSDDSIRVYRGDREVGKSAGQIWRTKGGDRVRIDEYTKDGRYKITEMFGQQNSYEVDSSDLSEMLEHREGRLPAWKGGKQGLAPLMSGAPDQLSEAPRVAPDRVLSHIGRRMFGDEFTGEVAIGLNKDGKLYAHVSMPDEAVQKYVSQQINKGSNPGDRVKLARAYGDAEFDGNGIFMLNPASHNMDIARRAMSEDYLKNVSEMAEELKGWKGTGDSTKAFRQLDGETAEDLVGEVVEVNNQFSPMKVLGVTEDGKLRVATPDTMSGSSDGGLVVDMADIKTVRDETLGVNSSFPRILQDFFEEGVEDAEFLEYLREIDPRLGSDNLRVGYRAHRESVARAKGEIFYNRLSANLDDESLKKMGRKGRKELAKKMGLNVVGKSPEERIKIMREAQKRARGINDAISDQFDQITREALDQFNKANFESVGKDVTGQKEIGEVWKGDVDYVDKGTKKETPKESYARAWSAFVNSAFNPINQSGVFAPEGRFIGERAGRAAAEYSEEMVRGAAFIAFVKQGMSMPAAAERAKRMHVDYSDLSQFEKRVMKRVFPFYSFTRGITPWVVDKLASEPGGQLAQTIRATRLAKDDDRELPDHVAGTTAIPVTGTPLEYIFGQSKDGGMKYLTGLGLMHEAPADFLGGSTGAAHFGVSPRNFMLQTASMSHPVIKAPLEWMTNQTFFQRGPEGGRSLDDLDPLVGRTITNVGDSITGARTREADMLPKGLEFAIANSPASRALTTARKIADPRRGFFDKALNTLTGFQTYDVNEAAEDAILREKISQQMRQMGAAEFTNTYFPEERLENMSESQRQRAERHLAVMQELRDRAKRRKAEREARKEEANR